MAKLIRWLMCVGLGVFVVKLVKKLFFSHDEERPPIRVRSGGSIEVTVGGGTLTDLGSEWRHEHGAPGPGRLLVTLVGTDCGTTSFPTNQVKIHCRCASGPLGPVTIQRQSSGGVAHAHVQPPSGAPRSQPSQTRVLVWPSDESVVIDHVKIGSDTCHVVNTAIAEVIVEQKRN